MLPPFQSLAILDFFTTKYTLRKQAQIATHWQQVIENDDNKAFEALFYLLNARLIKFGMYYVHQKEVVEEIVADVFVNCWLNRNKMAHVRNPETYLFICVKNSALNYAKKMSTIHLVDIDEHSAQLVDAYRPDHGLERKELLLKLDQAIGTLPQQCRIIFRLVKEDGLKCKEVADILNISTRTVHTQLYRAMNKLSAEMTTYQNQPDHTIITKISTIILAISAIGIFFL